MKINEQMRWVVWVGALGIVGCGFLSESATSLLVPPSEEVKLGLELAAEVELELVLHPDAQVQAEFQAMGDQLIAVLSPDVPEEYVFEFKVVQDDDMINAFAAPGGQIYFYTGLFLAAGNQAAVMGVLAHEIAHVTERHGAKQMVAQYGVETVLQMALGTDEGSWTSLLADLGTTGALLSYSRDDETEADIVGLDILVDAGYDPTPFADFFAVLGAEEGEDNFLSFLSTHPAAGERAEELKERIAAMGTVPTYQGDAAAWDAFLGSL